MIPDLRLPATPDPSGERHATWIELFFDLVFVVAVAQLDEGFLEHPVLGHALILIGMFVPVWWAWVGVAFYATRFAADADADALGFCLLVFAEMPTAPATGRSS